MSSAPHSAAPHSTDLFERYLQAVRKYLPWQRQDDIIAELRAISKRSARSAKPNSAARSARAR